MFFSSGFWGWWPFGLEGEWDLVLAGIQVGLCNRKMGFGVYRWVEGLWGVWVFSWVGDQACGWAGDGYVIVYVGGHVGR